MSQKRKSSGQTHLVMGRRCITEILRHDAERLDKVYVSSGIKRSKGKDELIVAIKERNIPLEELPAASLSKMVGSDSHQAFVGEVKTEPPMELSVFLDYASTLERSLVLVLDGIQDQQNVGALLRAAECFAVDAVLWSKNRTAPYGPVISKSSAGASELIPQIVVSNVAQAAKLFKQHSYWIATASLASDSVALDDFEPPSHIALIAGAEGRGVQPLLEKEADFRIHIPLFGKIESLNVAQATAIVLQKIATKLR